MDNIYDCMASSLDFPVILDVQFTSRLITKAVRRRRRRETKSRKTVKFQDQIKSGRLAHFI
jgi:hypothetical protein